MCSSDLDAEKYITDLFNTRKGDVWQATDPITRQVAGIFIATYPGRGNENLGYDIGLSDPELSLVAHMDTIVVHPLYRGQGLQQKLTALAEQDFGISCVRFTRTINIQRATWKNRIIKS